MKPCSICKINLPLDAFDIQNTGKFGRRADCKNCKRRFVRSPEGLVKQTYSNQKAKSRKRGHPAPSYTEYDLMIWFDRQPNFVVLYRAWEASDYQEDLRPSVDRIDDYLPYTLNNIQLTTKAQNVNRFYGDLVDGKNTKRCTAVCQHDLDGNFIQKFYSYAEAARSVNGSFANIRNVAEQKPINRREKDGTIRSWIPSKAYGYIWRKP
jgi:hypothetical protein